MKNKGLKDKGFYIALCSCIAIIAAIAYVGNHTTVPKDKKTSDNVIIIDSTPDPSLPLKTAPPQTPRPTKTTSAPATPAPKTNTPQPVKPSSPPAKAAVSQNIVDSTASPTPAPTFESNFQQPLVGDILTTFSDGALMYNKDLDDWRSHDGIDIKAEQGTDVKTIYNGIVSEITSTIHGKTIKIDHQNGYVSVYSNLDAEISAKVNDTVKKGDVIGKVGKTSISEQFMEPHLHFELLENGKYVNPNKFIQ